MIRGGIFAEGMVELWPGLYQVASIPSPLHLSPGADSTMKAVFPSIFPYKSSPIQQWLYSGISNLCVFIEPPPVFMVRVSCSEVTVSLFDALLPCVMASLSAKQ